MRRAVSDMCFVAALLLGIVCAAQAQFNSFPLGIFNGRAALDAASGGTHQVVFDAQSVTPPSGAAQTALNDNALTVGSGANRALVAVMTFSAVAQSCPPTALAVTWNGTSLASIIAANNSNDATNPCVVLYGLVNPASGNNTLAASWTGARDAAIAGISYTGVNQTGGATSFPNSNSASSGAGTSTASSVTITSSTQNAVVGGHVSNGAGFTSVSGTQVYRISAGLGFVSVAANRDVGAATVVLSTVISSASRWIAAGTDILAN